jgi:Uncharacterized conserved protein
MPRPTTKTDLLQSANIQFDKLWKLIDSMSEAAQTAEFAFEDRDRNLRDVLVHLYEWHKMVKSWHKTGTLEGGNPDVPGTGYTWKTLPALNVKIWEKYQSTDLQSSKAMLRTSHDMILSLIESHTNDELFARGVYKWTKTTTLGAYFVSCTSSHYDWAMKKIKNHIKTYVA